MHLPELDVVQLGVGMDVGVCHTNEGSRFALRLLGGRSWSIHCLEDRCDGEDEMSRVRTEDKVLSRGGHMKEREREAIFHKSAADSFYSFFPGCHSLT